MKWICLQELIGTGYYIELNSLKYLFNVCCDCRLFFEKSGKHLTGKVVHHSGRVLVTASTDEIGLNNVLKRFVICNFYEILIN